MAIDTLCGRPGIKAYYSIQEWKLEREETRQLYLEWSNYLYGLIYQGLPEDHFCCQQARVVMAQLRERLRDLGEID
jgi:hypothetical protein